MLLAGALAAGPALVVLLAARSGGGAPGILEIVADAVIRRFPPWLFDWGVKTLGLAAKGVLFGVICLGLPLAGGLLAVALRSVGLLGRRGALREALVAGLAALLLAELVIMPLAGVGVVGSGLLSEPSAVHVPLLVTSIAYGAFLAAIARGWRARMSTPDPAPPEPPEVTSAPIPRRTFLGRLLLATGLGAYAASAVTVLTRLGGPVRSTLSGAPDIAGVEGFGFQRAVTPASEFYFVSHDWVALEINPDTWHLALSGLVDAPRSWTLAELRALPSRSAYRTLQCISADSVTRSGLIGNQRWQGVRVRDVLELVAPRPEAAFIVWRCADGYHESLDFQTALEDDTWLVYEMGPPGTALPAEHGGPVRLLVAGRYGMAQPKYLTEMILSDHDEPGWWVAAGWQTDAPVRTHCRIDLPAADGVSDAVLAGTAFTAYGVASSGDRGISAVQVSIDGGTSWRDAEIEPLGDPIGRLTWVRWRAPIKLTVPGTLLFVARAADGSGRWQDEAVEAPFPRGASGYPRVPMRVYPSIDDAG